jgi:hypothetical protein
MIARKQLPAPAINNSIKMRGLGLETARTSFWAIFAPFLLNCHDFTHHMPLFSTFDFLKTSDIKLESS